MEQPQNTKDPVSLAIDEIEVEARPVKKAYVAPRLEVLDIEATRNGPGGTPDSGIDFS